MSLNIYPPLDLDALLAFATVARERNMRKAAQALNISQPPLSRKIRRLEEILGIILFTRHSDGMELTDNGARVLSIIRPFLRQYAKISEKLALLPQPRKQQLSVGITTAFEQGVFTPYLNWWEANFGDNYRVERKDSPKLARDVHNGKLDAAFVALPLHLREITAIELSYSERLLAALPSAWPESRLEFIDFSQLNGKPLFWFKRKRNPAYFDRMIALFSVHNFSPVFIEEPIEHDVLLARISFGEGWALMPESFAAIARAGVEFIRFAANCQPRLQLGFICANAKYGASVNEIRILARS